MPSTSKSLADGWPFFQLADMDAAPMTEAQLRTNFWWMSVCFSINHGTVTTPLVVASTLLSKDVGNIGNGVLYIATLLSSLFLGAPVVSSYGSKFGLLFGMFFYCIYVGAFAAAVLFKGVDVLSWVFFVGGSICGGVAAGVLWTAQGGYFGSSATELASLTGQERPVATASLAGKFAFVYLALEVVSKLGFSGLQALKIDAWIIAAFYCALGFLSFILMGRIHRFRDLNPAPVSPFSKALAAASLWRDPLIWLLSPTNLTFGFCAAFMNGYVNRNYAAAELGQDTVAFLASITAATAAAMARAFGPLAVCLGKGPVILIGAACFACIPLAIFVLGCCDGWKWWLIILYLLQGTGRAVYESTNRALFSDFFTGSKTEGAFANCMLQASLAFAASFFLQSYLSGKVLATIVVVLAALTWVCYLTAVLLLRRRQKEAAQPLNAPA